MQVYKVDRLVNTGVAGSLDAKLDIGDFVISKDAIYHDFDCHALNYPIGQVPGLQVRAFPADSMLVELAYSAATGLWPGHAAIGTVASGDQFVCNKEKKDKIIADTAAVCTEMEGAAIAHAAYLNKVSCVIIRAISDKADNSATMDYPTFEKQAIKHSVKLVRNLLLLI